MLGRPKSEERKEKIINQRVEKKLWDAINALRSYDLPPCDKSRTFAGTVWFLLWYAIYTIEKERKARKDAKHDDLQQS